MDAGLRSDLQEKVCNICNLLLNNNKLVTSKSVTIMLIELMPDLSNRIDLEDCIIKMINLWRLSRVGQLMPSTELSANDTKDKNYSDLYYQAYQKLSRYSKQLIKANKEIQFLKAKIKAINSFYSKQRSECIMRIESMLHK